MHSCSGRQPGNQRPPLLRWSSHLRLSLCRRQVLLVHPVTTLLMMGTVAAVIVFLVGGELWILNLRFNE
jgi:hypothetical protein